MIKGIEIGDHEIKIVSFAVDTTIFDHSKWDKISEGIGKNPYLELIGKKIIVN